MAVPHRWPGCGIRRGPGRQDGQALSEYVTMLGILVATVIACMAMFTAPLAAVYIRVFRRLVLYLTSTV